MDAAFRKPQFVDGALHAGGQLVFVYRSGVSVQDDAYRFLIGRQRRERTFPDLNPGHFALRWGVSLHRRHHLSCNDIPSIRSAFQT